MKFLLDEKFSRLAEKNGWTTDRAQGYVEGETARRSGKKPATWAVVGIDEYSLGFRAGYFERHTPDSSSSRKVATPDDARESLRPS